MRNVKVVSFAEGPIDAVLIRIPPRVEMTIQRDQLPPAVMSRHQRYLAIASMDGEIESLGSDVDQDYLRDDLCWDIPPAQTTLHPLPHVEDVLTGPALDVEDVLTGPAIVAPPPAEPTLVEPVPAEPVPAEKAPDEAMIKVSSNEAGKVVSSDMKADEVAYVDTIEPASDTPATPRRKKGRR